MSAYSAILMQQDAEIQYCVSTVLNLTTWMLFQIRFHWTPISKHVFSNTYLNIILISLVFQTATFLQISYIWNQHVLQFFSHKLYHNLLGFILLIHVICINTKVPVHKKFKPSNLFHLSRIKIITSACYFESFVNMLVQVRDHISQAHIMERKLKFHILRVCFGK